MKVTDERVNASGILDDIDPVIRALLARLESEHDNSCAVELRDNRLYSPYTNGCYLYANFRPENETKFKEWVEARWWCHLFIKPDEDNPGYWYILVLDPQAVCPVVLRGIFYPEL